MNKTKKKSSSPALNGVICLVIVIGFFAYLGISMGMANMLNTVMKTAHDLLINTVFYLMSICVLMGALSRLFAEFGVVSILEKLLRPVMTFLSDNPAIISLSKDKRFSKYFKKYQLISLTNFGTAFGMGLIVIVFMMGQGFFKESLIGLFGAFCGCIVSTRLMQRFTLKAFPQYLTEEACEGIEEEEAEEKEEEKKSLLTRILDCLLDGGRSGVEVGMSIIPGVLIISTFVMILTFGPSASGAYTGAAYEGVEILPWLADKIDFVFKALFGFNDPHLVAFPITSLGAVGAALSLVPNFVANGWADGNAIAVFTAIGMCWSGFLSTHTAMLDSLGYRELTPKAILAHTIGGLAAAFAAHWMYVLVSLF